MEVTYRTTSFTRHLNVFADFGGVFDATFFEIIRCEFDISSQLVLQEFIRTLLAR